MVKIILASASPRRRELLNSLGLEPLVKVSNVVEERQPDESVAAYIERNAHLKAKAVAQDLEPLGDEVAVIVSADTIVEVDGALREKPRDYAHAQEMLAELSGRTHVVRTCFCLLDLRDPERFVTQTVATEVTFKQLSREEILRYCDTGEPFDKAGGYGVQARGAYLVDRIAGSYTNVVGLPLCQLVEALRAFTAGAFQV